MRLGGHSVVGRSPGPLTEFGRVFSLWTLRDPSRLAGRGGRAGGSVSLSRRSLGRSARGEATAAGCIRLDPAAPAPPPRRWKWLPHLLQLPPEGQPRLISDPRDLEVVAAAAVEWRECGRGRRRRLRPLCVGLSGGSPGRRTSRAPRQGSREALNIREAARARLPTPLALAERPPDVRGVAEDRPPAAPFLRHGASPSRSSQGRVGFSPKN